MILQQVFNSIEEITENTVGDTNLARVAEYKQMKFEIRGYPDDFGNHDLNTSLAKQRANTVLEFLTYLGTPPRRLTATAALPSQSVLDRWGKNKRGKIEFIRKRISSP